MRSMKQCHYILRYLRTNLGIVEKQSILTDDIGYPFIGLANRYYDEVERVLSEVRGMECLRGQHWGICRVPDRKCDEVGLDQELSFKINNNDFTIPLKNIAVYVNITGQYFCQT